MQLNTIKEKLLIGNICVCIANVDSSIIDHILKDCYLAELRLDLLKISNLNTEKLFKTGKSLIVTYRQGNESIQTRIDVLSKAIKEGANYIDLDLNEDGGLIKELITLAHQYDVKVIVSYHNFNETPGWEKLKEIVEKCQSLGADIVKIACKVNQSEDLIWLSGLYNNYENILSFGMGKLGISSRILAPVFGAPFTYAHHRLSEPTAPGQYELNHLIEIYKSMGYY